MRLTISTQPISITRSPLAKSSPVVSVSTTTSRNIPQRPSVPLGLVCVRCVPWASRAAQAAQGGRLYRQNLQTKLTDKAYRQRLQAKPYPIAQGFRPTSARRRSRGDL